MSLSRSASGLAAEHLLYGVDVIVWTEGGTPRDGDEAGAAEAGTAPFGDDVQFWREVFRNVKPKLKARFKPAGSKTRIRELAQQIQTLKLAHVVACMDRDHDDLTGQLVNDDNVVYTRDYSWENDCWTVENVSSAFEDLYSGTEPPKEILEILNHQSREASRRLRWHVRADVLRSISGMPRYLSANTKRISAHQGKSIPQLKTEFLIERCRELNRPKFRTIALPEIRVESHCIGHILANYYYHTLRVLVHRHLGEPLSHLTAKTLVVKAFSAHFRSSKRLKRYYSEAISRVRLVQREE